MAAFTNWRALRAEIAVDEERVAAYRRVIEAEQQLYALLERRGLAGAALDAAFDALQAAGAAAETDDDPYLSTVSGEVTALGGRLDVRPSAGGWLEIRAVFSDTTLTLPNVPHYTF